MFAPLTGDRLDLTFPLRRDLDSYDPVARTTRPLGIAVADVAVPGVTRPPADVPVDLPCGQGPAVTLDGAPVPTRVHTTVRALLAGARIPAALCGRARTPALAAGPHRLVVPAIPAFGVASATLTAPAASVAPVVRTPADLITWTAEDRSVGLPARTSPTLLVIPENTNPGWVATLADGTGLPTRTVDGWQQGYVVPPGAATTVTLRFTPGPYYRAALGGGALAALAVLVVALVPGRPRGRDAVSLPPLHHRRGTRAAVVHTATRCAAVVVAVGLTGGTVGLSALAALTVAGGIGEAGGRVAPGRRESLLGALAAAALLVAGAGLAFGDVAAVPRQALAAVGVAALAAALLPRPRWPRRGRRAGAAP